MHRLGHRCVLASELDEDLRELYPANFGIQAKGDIREVVENGLVPAHDILCAGFPCQPFSKAGEQQGFDCPKNGDLFEYVMRIVQLRRPRYIILENVPNLTRHNNGGTWQELVSRLENADYDVDAAPLSPHKFGVPQIRERIFIVASRKGIRAERTFEWPKAQSTTSLSIDSVLDAQPESARPLPQHVIDCLNAWQDFLDRFPKDDVIPGSFPFWSMEWGATYPFEQTTPWAIGERQLRRFRGSHGASLAGRRGEHLLQAIPSYARTREACFPGWKVRFIQLNREFYQRHRRWMDEWMPSILPFPSSRQKLEWNIKGGERNIWEYVIQLRASGVRVKRRTTAPSLVAMTTTQVPIIAWERRYITDRECARLQSMDELVHLPPSRERAYKALGNAVNARVVQLVAERLIGSRVVGRPPANARSGTSKPARRRSISSGHTPAPSRAIR
jgi:DNA (cytosine-5)-methyltransferase 1